jgi:hypothetical protein
MPFGFHRRPATAKEQPAAGGSEGTHARVSGGGRTGGARTGVPFDGLTEEWRLVGVMELEGRLLDILNRREAIPIGQMTWATLDSVEDLQPAAGLQKVDPYDLIVVLAGDETLPPLNDAEKSALRVHKVAYDVILELPPYRVIGTVFLHAGSEPERLMDRGSDLFFPVTNAVALVGDVRVSDAETDVVLVNRSYLRGVEQVERLVVENARNRKAAPPAG